MCAITYICVLVRLIAALKLNVTNSRMWGNVVGIATAVGLSHCPPFFSSETEVRFLCQSLMGDCSRCISLMGMAFVRSVCTSTGESQVENGGKVTSHRQVQINSCADAPMNFEESNATIRLAREHPGSPATQSSPRTLGVELGHAKNASCPAPETGPLRMNYEEFAGALSHGQANQPSKRGREAKWKRGFCGTGFPAIPETFKRTLVATDLNHHHKHACGARHHRSKETRDRVRKKFRKPVRALAPRRFAYAFRFRHHSSRQLAS